MYESEIGFNFLLALKIVPDLDLIFLLEPKLSSKLGFSFFFFYSGLSYWICGVYYHIITFKNFDLIAIVDNIV